MRLLATALAVLLLAPATYAQAPAGDSQLFSEIDSIVAGLSRITGLKPKGKVAYDMMDRERLKVFLEDRITELVKPEEIRAEELTLKKFGFIPQTYDLKASTIELLTEQAAAFYDFRKKKLFVLEGASGILQQTALVHELAHALADQHFNLEKFIERGKSDDIATARMAVMEGQASWLMAEYAARRMGQSLKENRGLLETMTNPELAAGQFPVFDKAPLYVRETLLFPYTGGMRFQHAIFESMGQASFSEVFRNPPVSTQQVLHPGLYFARKQPASPPLPEASELENWKELAAGTIGELDHAILLRQYGDKREASNLARKWAGGRYRLLEDKGGQSTALLYASEWETPEAARDFFAAYHRVLKGKWRTMVVMRDERDLLAGQGDDGRFIVSLEGKRVSSVEGLK